MADGQRRLGALLLEMGVLGKAQLEQAMSVQMRSGERLAKVLADLGLVREPQLLRAISRHLGLEGWDPEHTPWRADACAVLPRDMAFGARVVPVEKRDEAGSEVLVVATSDPLAPLAGHVVRFLSDRGASVRWMLATEAQVDRALHEAYGESRPRADDGATPLLDSYAVVKGRPDTPPPARTRPNVQPVRTEGPSAAELEMAVVIDTDREAHRGIALRHDGGGAIEGRRPGPDLSVRARKDPSAPIDHTLLADDAVLEIVELDDEPLAMEVEVLPLEAPVDADRGAVPSAPPASVEPVALARLAIRRAEGAIREIAPKEVLERHPSAPGTDGTADFVPLDLSLEVLTPVPHLDAPQGSSGGHAHSVVDGHGSRQGSQVPGRPGDGPTDDVFGSEPTAGERVPVSDLAEDLRASSSNSPGARLSPSFPSGDVDPVDEPLEFEFLDPVSDEAGGFPETSESIHEDRAAQLHARLIRFAAGETLPDAYREDALRIIVAALLEQGLVNEPSILRLLSDAGKPGAKSGQ